MKHYELTYLISPDLSEEEAKIFSQKIALLVQEKGIVLNKTSPIKKILSYRIKKENQAFLSTLIFQLNPVDTADLTYDPSANRKKLDDLENKLKAEKKVLRYLILVAPAISKKIVKTNRISVPSLTTKGKITTIKKEKKVELKEIGEKLDEILKSTN